MHTNSASDFTCPMHPEIRSVQAGMCLECGMNLVREGQKSVGHGHGGDLKARHQDAPVTHRNGEHRSHNIFKTKFWVSFALSIPIVLYSHLIRDVFGFMPPAFPGSAYLPAVLGTIVFFYGGSVFIIASFRELRARAPGMMTLIALAISVAYVYSIGIVITRGARVAQGEDQTIFWELATLIVIMLLGHWLEARAVSGAQNALKELSKLLPDMAEVLRQGKAETVPLGDLKRGDAVLVKPGGRVPADGTVIDGASYINEAIITGESKPVLKRQDDKVIAGTINGDGSLTVSVTGIGEETFLAGVMRLVAEAQASKSRLQVLSDKAAFYLTITAIVVGAATLLVWLWAADVAFAINRMVAVLVVTCPHALGLAVPLVASISTTKAARNGFLVKKRLSLESARNIDTVLFDKTGTLTRGEFGVDKIIPAVSMEKRDVLLYAASVNNHSEHPIAQAMVQEAERLGLYLKNIQNFQRLPGMGVRAEIDGEEVLVGSIAIAEEKGVKLSTDMKTEAETLSRQGKTINVVLRGGSLLGILAFADSIREESREAIGALTAMGIDTAMITGDAEDVARWVAGELGIKQYFARVLPEQKSEKVKLLQADGRKVAMVGDGVNDAPALAQADLGVAIGAGTNVAIESAGIILVANDPRALPKIITLSRLTYTKMIQNLFWATGYNIVAIPLAAGVLANRGIFLEPALAAAFMSVSTVIVAANAMILKNKTIK